MARMLNQALRAALRWIPAIVMMALIFSASSLPATDIPRFGEWDVLVKKSGHAIGYALLGVTYFFALPKSLSNRYKTVLAILMVVLFALSDEFHQSFVEGRTSSLRDVAIDTAGAAAALIFVNLYSSNSRSNSRS
jgi:VanZ family protein